MPDAPLLQILLIQLLAIAAAGGLLGAVTDRLKLGRFAGVMLAGLLLSISVMGRFWPTGYQWAFDGGARAGEIQQQIEKQQTQLRDNIEALKLSGVSEAAIHIERQTHHDIITQLQTDLTDARRPYRTAANLLLAVCAVWWLIAAGYGTQLGRLNHFLIDALPMGITAVATVAAIGLGVMWLLGHFAGGYLDRCGIPHDMQSIIGLVIVGVCAALPLGNPAMRRLGGTDTPEPPDTPNTPEPPEPPVSPLDDLPKLAASASAWLTLICLGALAVIGADTLTGEAGKLAENSPLNIGVVVGAAIIALAVVGPLLRWVTQHTSMRDRSGMLRITVGLALATPLVIWLDLHPLWLALVVPMGLSWTAGDSSSPSTDVQTAPLPATDTLPLPGIVVCVTAMMHIDTWQHIHWLSLLVALVVTGDGKAIGTMLAARLFGRRSWGDALQLGVVLCIGGPTVVIAALGLHRCGIINDNLYASLLYAATITACCCRPLLHIARGLCDDDRTRN